MEDEYYKAYEERYKKVHESNNLWEIPKPTPEVLNTINKYKITKDSKILELGSGEGRDVIFLLDKGYNVLALEYSISAVNKCKKLTNNKGAMKKMMRGLDDGNLDINDITRNLK